MSVGPEPRDAGAPGRVVAALAALASLARSLARGLLTLALMAAVAFGAGYLAVTIELDRRGLTGAGPAPEALAARVASLEDKTNRLGGDVEAARRDFTRRVDALAVALEQLSSRPDAPAGAPPEVGQSAPADLVRLERSLDTLRWILKAQGELVSARLELARLNAGKAADELGLAEASLRAAAAAFLSAPAAGEEAGAAPAPTPAAGAPPEPLLPERGPAALAATLRRLADQAREAASDLRAGRPTGPDRLGFVWHGLGTVIDGLLAAAELR